MLNLHDFVGRIRRLRRIRHKQSALCQQSEAPAMCRGFFLTNCSDKYLYTNGFQNALTEYGDYADPQVLLHSQKDIAQTPFVARSLW